MSSLSRLCCARGWEMSKALQAAKIREIREALVATGCTTLSEQTHALGLCRSTTWTVLQAAHKNSGLSPAVINRMLDCPQLPTAVRRKVLEYVAEKLSGRYGHSETQLHRFTCKLTITNAIRFDPNPPPGALYDARAPVAWISRRPVRAPPQTVPRKSRPELTSATTRERHTSLERKS